MSGYNAVFCAEGAPRDYDARRRNRVELIRWNDGPVEIADVVSAYSGEAVQFLVGEIDELITLLQQAKAALATSGPRTLREDVDEISRQDSPRKGPSRGWLRVSDGERNPALAGFDRKIVGIEFDAAVEVDVALQDLDSRVQADVGGIGVGESDVSRRSQDDTHAFAAAFGGSDGSEEHGSARGKALPGHSFDGSDDQIVGHEEVVSSEVVDDNASSHDSSPSVGAPSGAVCDNPNPTDGGYQGGAAPKRAVVVQPGAAAPSPAAAAPVPITRKVRDVPQA